MWLRKRNLKREMESLLIATQNNAIRTNHIKARIDKTQQNGKCRLCSDRDEGDARGVMVIVVGNGHGDTSSNPQRD